MKNKARRLAERLGYSFQQPRWLEQALTHRSFGTPHNERLEFLGDGILDFVIADELFQRFPQLDEGRLSRLRANLVRQETLAEVAQRLGVGEALALGEGELHSGGNNRPSILADALEALFAAVYLDGGFAAARQLIVGLFADLLSSINLNEPQKDSKSLLQEWLQARHRSLPHYELQATHGVAHDCSFVVICTIDRQKYGVGEGRSRRIAEQAAARVALARLQNAPHHEIQTKKSE